MRSADLDPDYRHNPKSNFHCIRCQKSLTGKKHRWVVLDDPAYGTRVVHPEDAAEGSERFPVGLDCARQIGMEFSVKI